MTDKTYEQELYDKLREMELHQTIHSGEMIITKVINGWIYRFRQIDNIISEIGEVQKIENVSPPCFVPLLLPS